MALHALCYWTPTASVAGAGRLWLELTETPIFLPVRNVWRRLTAYFTQLRFTVAVAVAGTPGAVLSSVDGPCAARCKLRSMI